MHKTHRASGNTNQGRQRKLRGATLLVLMVASSTAPRAASAHDQVPGEPQTNPVLLKGGDLYTVSHGVLAATDLLFDNGKITKIERNISPPAGAEVIDVRGSRVYPGLIAPYTNLGLIEIGAVRATEDRREVGRVTPEVAAHIAFNPDSALIPTVRSHGITTTQVVPLGSLIRGRSMIVHLDGWTKEDAAVKLIDGLHIGWPSVSVNSRRGAKPTPKEQREKMAEERRQLRRAFEEATAYHQAIDVNREQKIDLRWEAMRPVLTREQPVYIVANDYRQIAEAVAFAKEFKLRMILVGGKESYKLTDLLKENDIPVIVGTTTSLPMRRDDDYDIAYRLPSLLDDAGVTFCLSHITWGAWDVRNLAFQGGQAVAFGLSKEAALAALTLSTAEILGIDHLQGSLDVGKTATLFVSEGDVMDTIGQSVTHMFIEGRSVDLDNRHKMLYRKYDRKKYPVTGN